MTAAENPYQPPTAGPATAKFDGRLTFDGEMTEDDYLRLLPIKHYERWLWIILAGLLLLVVVPICVAGLAMSIYERDFTGVTVVSVFLAVTIFTLFYIRSRINLRTIAGRKLKQHPDLLSVAQGEFSADGMLFHDGVHQYWFSPSILSMARVSEAGIAVQLEDDLFRYLAITTRLLNHFNLPIGELLKSTWRDYQVSQDPASWPMWNRIGRAPDNSIHFRYSFTVAPISQDTGWKPMPQLQNAIASALSYLVLLGLGVYAWRNVGVWMVVGILLYMGFNLLAMLPWFRRGSAAPESQEVTQYGWLSDDEFATCNWYSGMRMPRSILRVTEQTEDMIVFQMHAQPLHIPRSALLNPDDWQRLCATG